MISSKGRIPYVDSFLYRDNGHSPVNLLWSAITQVDKQPESPF